MKAELQGIEVERAIVCDDDFAVKHTARGQLRAKRLEQFRKVAVQRFFVATLDQDLVLVAKHQGTKPIPFRFEDPCSAYRQFADSFGEHRQNWRVHRKMHILVFILHALSILPAFLFPTEYRYPTLEKGPEHQA